MKTHYFPELELTNPETLKNEGFGASHRTYQVIPQVKFISDQFIFLRCNCTQAFKIKQGTTGTTDIALYII